jgi:hypothetical protein
MYQYICFHSSLTDSGTYLRRNSEDRENECYFRDSYFDIYHHRDAVCVTVGICRLKAKILHFST